MFDHGCQYVYDENFKNLFLLRNFQNFPESMEILQILSQPIFSAVPKILGHRFKKIFL